MQYPFWVPVARRLSWLLHSARPNPMYVKLWYDPAALHSAPRAQATGQLQEGSDLFKDSALDVYTRGYPPPKDGKQRGSRLTAEIPSANERGQKYTAGIEAYADARESQGGLGSLASAESFQSAVSGAGGDANGGSAPSVGSLTTTCKTDPL